MIKFLFRLAVAIAVVAAGAAALGTVAWSRIHEPFRGFEGEERFVEIPPGAASADIRRRLTEAGVVKDERTFRVALWWSGAGRSLKAGEYRFDRPLSAIDVIDKLERGDVFTMRITFPEGLTIREMAAIFEQRGFGAAPEFIAAAAAARLIADLDPQATDLEGYLFPDTYSLPRRAEASAIVAGMVARFKSRYEDDLRQRAAQQGLTTRQVVTLASLVEKETAQPQERPIVAGVYRNRMKINMPMQADPTVIYALSRAGKYDGNIRRTDLAFDSPYNTYKYPGLPPGPIAAPGKAALEAAVNPADVRYLYFVSRNDGSHVFAETLAQHNANVQQHQVLYFRKGAAGKGLGGRAVSGNGQSGNRR
jgi:UPF0755 protein